MTAKFGLIAHAPSLCRCAYGAGRCASFPQSPYPWGGAGQEPSIPASPVLPIPASSSRSTVEHTSSALPKELISDAHSGMLPKAKLLTAAMYL